MEINTEVEVDGVPFAQQRRPQESLQNTPVAKKTRSFARLKSTDDDLLGALQKTPNGAASTSSRLLSETPRRSSRKSVRPPMDYEDIVENSLLRSASKAKKDVDAAPADAAEEEEEATAQKWNAAEVGRHSRKRGRKSKRATSKRAKKEEKEAANEEEQEEECADVGKKLKNKCTTEAEELVIKYTMEVKVQKEECAMEPKAQEELKLQETQPEADVKESQEEDAQREDSQEHKKQGELKLQEIQPEEDVKESQEEDTQREDSQKKDSQDKHQSCEEKLTELNVESVPEILVSSSSPEDANKSVETTVSGVAIEDMDELGLCPLSADESDDKAEEEHNEDMPSLVVLDDEDPTDELNRTFEIDSPTGNGNEAVEQQIEEQEQMDIDMPILQMSPEKPIKIVLTNENDEDRTLLRMDSLTSPSSKPYRFPTPMKSTSKMNFKFTAGNITETLELNESCRGRRRSKSVCGINGEKAKTVSFFSPIEVTAVTDIDKRWEKLNISHVTQRRKRSKSLDAPIPKSRIPKPKFFPLVKAPTPVKLKARTKLPNFAAIHQKQFNKMENLVDHLERKAVRAKELTSSAVKLANNNASAQKSSAKKLPMANVMAAERPRPRAVKKIELLSNLLTPLKPEEILRQKNLPTPRNIIQQQPRSRLPLINKPITKIFSSISSAPAPSSSIRKPPPTAAPAPAPVPVQSKLEARRQRHMEMFKGRTTKENKSDFIRGVRSNRRFQLQMEHRRQMNEK